MEKILNRMEKIDKIILLILKILTVIILLVITVIVTGNILIRHWATLLQKVVSSASFQHYSEYIKSIIIFIQNKTTPSLHWLDEIIEMLFAGMVFYGASALWVTKGHFSAGDWISKLIKNDTAKKIYRLLLEIIVLGFLGLFFYYTFSITIKTREVTNALMISKKIIYSCMPISGIVMLYFGAKNIFIEIVGIIDPKALESFNKNKS